VRPSCGPGDQTPPAPLVMRKRVAPVRVEAALDIGDVVWARLSVASHLPEMQHRRAPVRRSLEGRMVGRRRP
jgi:hypothetical protein